jgi:hypothetical protein
MLTDERILESLTIPGLNVEASLEPRELALLLQGMRAILAASECCDSLEFDHNGQTMTVRGDRASIKVLLQWRKRQEEITNAALRKVASAMSVLRVIAEQDPVEMALDPQWAKRMAQSAIRALRQPEGS